MVNPATIEPSFAELQLAPILVDCLISQKIMVPTEVQLQTIPLILAGQDLVAVAETGSGKTLAYLLPILTKLIANPVSRAVILSPTRETAEQIFRVLNSGFKGLPFAIGSAFTGTPMATQVKELKKNPRLIVATPGRMQEHLQGNKLLLKGLDILVIDEADRMLDKSFIDQLKFIASTLRGERQTLMYSATNGDWVESIAKIFTQKNPATFIADSAGKPVSKLKQNVFFMSPSQKENKLRDELKNSNGGIIVFANSQESCLSIGRFLQHHGFSSEFIHGEMNPGHRNRVLREFRENKIQVLVATDMLARGLDIPSIGHVINFDLPYKAEDFLHRLGRTARAGQGGKATTFITPADGRSYRRIKQYLVNSIEEYLTKDFTFTERT